MGVQASAGERIGDVNNGRKLSRDRQRILDVLAFSVDDPVIDLGRTGVAPEVEGQSAEDDERGRATRSSSEM